MERWSSVGSQLRNTTMLIDVSYSVSSVVTVTTFRRDTTAISLLSL